MTEKVTMALVGLLLGLLIGLHSQHKQKDYLIKLLLNDKIGTTQKAEEINLPKNLKLIKD